MGWLGYTERETLETTIPALESAYAAKLEMLALMHTGQIGFTDTPPPAPSAVSSETVFSAFRIAANQ